MVRGSNIKHDIKDNIPENPYQKYLVCEKVKIINSSLISQFYLSFEGISSVSSSVGEDSGMNSR